MRYSIDTSSLIKSSQELYPQDVFPALWERVDDLIRDGSLRATEEVLHELEKQEDELFRWAKARPEFFVEIDEPIQSEVKNILRAHRRLLEAFGGRSGADPFVIALARLNGAIVVTEEARSARVDRPKIPNVCDALGVQCITFLDLIRANGWRF